MIHHFKKVFNVSFQKCPKKKANILIINRNRRNNRKILNFMDVQQALKKKTLQNVEGLYMEKLSFVEQMQKIECADIFIGVHGAGLAW